jgi:hypothetical protein
MQYLRNFFVGWVERRETQRICWVMPYGTLRDATLTLINQPTNLRIKEFFDLVKILIWQYSSVKSFSDTIENGISIVSTFIYNFVN